jgi:ABC-type Fe3+-hydroxamate transport system substrate-binding protein
MTSQNTMRSVSLCPSTTETLIDFGLADQIVGITRFCIHPKDVVESLPRVGGTKDPKLEKIAAAKPDLVFMNQEENRYKDYEWLNARFEVDVSMPTEPKDIPPLLRRWGQRLGGDASAVAEARARAIEAELAAAAPAPAAGGRPTFAYLIWRRPFMTAGEDTYIHRLLEGAGGENALPGLGRYPEIELDALAEKAPDLVLLPDEPFPFDARHVPEVKDAMPDSTRVLLVSGDDLSWHGVRTLRGLRLARALFSGTCTEGDERWSADSAETRTLPT